MRSSLRYLLLFLLPLVLWLMAEGMLRLGYGYAWTPWISRLFQSEVPTAKIGLINAVGRPSKSGCKRVAVFGDSAAAGMHGTVSFAQLLDLELNPAGGDCFLVHSYAESGATFAHYSGPLALRLVREYDIAVVYSGHGEIWKEVCRHRGFDVYRTSVEASCAAGIEQKIERNVAAAKTGGGDFSLRQEMAYLIGARSFVHAAAWQARRDLVAKRHTSEVDSPIATRPSEGLPAPKPQDFPKPIEPGPVVPVTQIDRMVDEYGVTLAQLADAYRAQRKLLIVATVFSHDLFPPMFSYRRDGTGPLAADQFRIGQDALSKRDFISGWKALEMARNLDGFPWRVVASINDRIRGLKTDDFVRIVDVEAHVRRYVEAGTGGFDDFLADPQHPNFYGHSLIARDVLCAMGKVPYCTDWSLQDHMRYRAKFSHQAYGERRFRRIEQQDLAESFRWHLSMSRMSSNPASFLHRAAEILVRIEVLPQQHERKKALIEVLRAMSSIPNVGAIACPPAHDANWTDLLNKSPDFVDVGMLRAALKHPELRICKGTE